MDSKDNELARQQTMVPLSRASVLRHTLISMFRDFSRVNKYE